MTRISQSKQIESFPSSGLQVGEGREGSASSATRYRRERVDGLGRLSAQLLLMTRQPVRSAAWLADAEKNRSLRVGELSVQGSP